MKVKIADDNGSEIVSWEPQKRDMGGGWIKMSCQLMYNPEKKLIQDVCIWTYPQKKWWQFWK